MKILRYSLLSDSKIHWGILEGGNVFALRGEPLGDFSQGPMVGPLNSVKTRPPCQPSKVICAAINFHGARDWEPGMTEPLIFLKSPSSIIAADETIESPITDVGVWGEAELTIVIGRRARDLSRTEAASAIFGYTIGNDVSCDNTGTRDHHLARSKAADAFCPLGPYIDTDYDPRHKGIRAVHNGRIVREGNTDDFFWDPLTLVSRLSQWMTLEPWDVILTGSPPMIGDVAYLQPGDEFSAEVEGFMPLRSRYDIRRAVRRPEPVLEITR